jgi:chromosomal replication initiation ATPase DnaA
MTTRNVNAIVELVADLTGVDPATIKSRSKVSDVARARQLVAWTARHALKMSFIAIGTRLERHHSTVIYDVRRVDQERQSCPETAQLCLSLLTEFGHARSVA